MKDKFTNKWIIENGVPIVKQYGGNLTLRSLFYRLVADLGMTNSQRHYKRVVNAMISARWEGLVEFDDFNDHEREVIGKTEFEETSVEESVEDGKQSIRFWMDHYRKNRWENQPFYVEVFIEKKALQGVFERPCYNKDVALFPCKGYPSLTWLFEAKKRLQDAYNQGKNPVILYFGDYDPSGEDIPRSIIENIERMGFSNFELKRCALMEKQVVEWNLPPAPTKKTDSRSASWDGLGQVELDAVEPNKLRRLCEENIDAMFDFDLHQELLEAEEVEREEYRNELKEFVKGL